MAQGTDSTSMRIYLEDKAHGYKNFTINHQTETFVVKQRNKNEQDTVLHSCIHVQVCDTQGSHIQE